VDLLVAAVRQTCLDEPDIGVKKLVEKIKMEHPEIEAGGFEFGAREVRQAKWAAVGGGAAPSTVEALAPTSILAPSPAAPSLIPKTDD
jgi:hypothetical protein